MKRCFVALIAGLMLGMVASVGPAWAGLSPTGAGTQTADQSQTASNTVDKSAEAKSASLNLSPNIAVFNSGGCGCDGVDQSSNSSSSAAAVNENSGSQSNEQGQPAGQWQSGSSGGSDPSQSVDQSQTA